jgi:NADH-quinone oxidoreductase subunit K
MQKYLILSGLIFCIGLYGVLSRRSIIAILLSIELILNSAALNFVVFSMYIKPLVGQVFVVFLIAIAAAEACVALAITINIYKLIKTQEVDEINLLKG